MPRHLANRLGRRGAMLTLLGVTHLLFALQILLRSEPLEVAGAWHQSFPRALSIVLWALPGLVAVLFAWRRVPPGLARPRWWHGDALAWPLLYLMPAVRFLSYGTAWVTWQVTGTGSPGAWYSAVLHLPLIAAVLICAGWAENRALPPPGEDER